MKFRVVLFILLSAAELVWSQTPSARGPEFDVISVKPANPDANARPRLTCKGGRLSAFDMPAQFLIEYAYDIRDTFPLPDWARPNGDKYNVEATTPDNSTTAATCKLMTQRLLEDRFQLKLRKEVRETNVYFLTVAKGKAETEAGIARQHAHRIRWRLVAGSSRGTGRRLPALVVNLNDLQDVGRRVVDKTGLPADVFYEFRFDYTPGQTDPDVFYALETQLGLKLIPGKAPIEFEVADRISKPFPN